MRQPKKNLPLVEKDADGDAAAFGIDQGHAEDLVRLQGLAFESDFHFSVEALKSGVQPETNETGHQVPLRDVVAVAPPHELQVLAPAKS